MLSTKAKSKNITKYLSINVMYGHDRRLENHKTCKLYAIEKLTINMHFCKLSTEFLVWTQCVPSKFLC